MGVLLWLVKILEDKMRVDLGGGLGVGGTGVSLGLGTRLDELRLHHPPAGRTTGGEE